MKKTTHNQHYIPRSIQKQFSDNKKEVYYTLVESDEIRRIHVKHTMTSKDTHEHPAFPENTLEDNFKKFEDKFIINIKNIESELNKNNDSDTGVVKKYLYANLSDYIFMYYRSGALLYEYSFDISIPRPSKVLPFNIPNNIPSEKPLKHEKVIHMLNRLLNSDYLDSLSQTLKEYYSFAILKNEEENFILSDQFISTVALGIKTNDGRISNRNMGLKDVMLLIPISAKYYLVLYNGKKPDFITKDEICNLDNEQTEDINNVIINNSYKEAVSKKLEPLQKAKTSFNKNVNDPTGIFFCEGNELAEGAIKKKELFYYKKDQLSSDMYYRLLISGEHNYFDYLKVTRNDDCPCNSGLKFKKCCQPYFSEVKRIYQEVCESQINRNFDCLERYAVSPDATIEKSPVEFDH